MDLSGAPATYAFILVTTLVSLYALYFAPNFIDEFSCRVGAIDRKRGHHRLLTSAFLHANIFHLALNMMVLYSFGPVMETILGTTGFIVLYLGSTLGGSLMILVNNRNNPSYSAIGASGAVSGVILAFCLFLPFEKIYFIGIPFGVPAYLFAALFLIISAQLMRTPDRVISHEGHLGGAIAGVVLAIVMRPDVIGRIFG